MTSLVPLIIATGINAVVASNPLRLYATEKIFDTADSVIQRISGFSSLEGPWVYSNELETSEPADSVERSSLVIKRNYKGYISHPTLKKMEEMDFFHQVKYCRYLLKDIHEQIQHVPLKHSFQIALNGVDHILQEIYMVILNLENQIHHHKTKWFSSWRGLSINPHLIQLVELGHKLEKRLDELQKTIQLWYSFNVQKIT